MTGGQLSASFQELPAPAPSADLTVGAWATAYRDGSMRLTGTYTCANADHDAFIDGTVTQTVGRTKIQGGFFVYPLECDGQARQWEAIATSCRQRVVRRRVRARRLRLHHDRADGPGPASSLT